MKILLCFLDMLRPDLLGLYGNTLHSEVDDFFQGLGGTIYQNCYSPGPDTPRSTGCLLTGCYPKNNGCDARVKYPKYFLHEKNLTFLDVLKENNVNLRFYLDAYNREIGFLPEGFYEEEYLKGSDLTIQDYLDKYQVCDNSFTFLYFPDFHNIVMDNGYSAKTPKLGLKKVNDILKVLKNKGNLEQYDYCIFLSDHGYQLKKDLGRNLLDSYRSQIFMFVHKNSDRGLIYDKKLRSIMDVAPSIVRLFTNENFSCDGKDLLLDESHEILLLEDHADFSVKVNQSIERYAVFTRTDRFFTDCSGIWTGTRELEQKEKNNFEILLEKTMTDYSRNRFLYDRLQIYNKFIYIKTNSDGTIRKKSIKLKFKESKFFRMTKKLMNPIVRYFV